jgi:hypothetical protein
MPQPRHLSAAVAVVAVVILVQWAAMAFEMPYSAADEIGVVAQARMADVLRM